MKFLFTGTATTVFPTIVTDAGTLVAEPGTVVDLEVDPGHPDLVLVDDHDGDVVAAAVVDDTADRPLAPGQVRVAAAGDDDTSTSAEPDTSDGPDADVSPVANPDTTKPRSRRSAQTEE